MYVSDIMKLHAMILTTTAMIIQIGIQRISDSTMTVPTIFALMNITAQMSTHTDDKTVEIT